MKTFPASITLGILSAIALTTAHAAEVGAPDGVWWKNSPLYQQAPAAAAMTPAKDHPMADATAIAAPWWANAPLTARLFDVNDKSMMPTQLTRMSGKDEARGM